ncbi:PaaI family thioesterase [Marinobacterium arenosum]|uniref:PaaI family thioesterase n=1 Tax=Marinobacterium arenosum TaxID=2862496 RepID=UPI001C95A7B6|nr:PaaI family thioesterase [Marinobacterium arenosum]MBY4678745.1 PaaI family thioesterase [Marinobacterium arenosum]
MIDCQNTGPHQVELSQWVELAPFESLLNMQIEKAADGCAVLTMPFCYQYSQGAGVLHGGALTALADTAVAMAIKTVLPEGTRFGTIKLETRFLRPGIKGIFRCEAEVGAPSERDYPTWATVYNEAGEAVIEFEAVFRVARKQPGPALV